MKVIVNADDFGYSEQINRAICQAFESKLISQSSIIVNLCNYNNALSLSKEHKFFDKIGLHLNLTEGNPTNPYILKNKKLTDKNGQFTGTLATNLKNKFFLTPFDIKCIKIEVNSQMKKYINSGFTLMHLDSHHHIHTVPSIFFIILKMAKLNGFKSIRLSRNIVSPSESYLKILYKKAVNTCIRFFFKTTDFFGEYYFFNSNYIGDGSVEIMVHPDKKDDKIVDVLKKGVISVDMRTYDYRTNNLISYNEI